MILYMRYNLGMGGHSKRESNGYILYIAVVVVDGPRWFGAETRHGECTRSKGAHPEKKSIGSRNVPDPMPAHHADLAGTIATCRRRSAVAAQICSKWRIR